MMSMTSLALPQSAVFPLFRPALRLYDKTVNICAQFPSQMSYVSMNREPEIKDFAVWEMFAVSLHVTIA